MNYVSYANSSSAGVSITLTFVCSVAGRSNAETRQQTHGAGSDRKVHGVAMEGRVILESIINTFCGRMCSGFMWLWM
jgi:hypothetical protein